LIALINQGIGKPVGFLNPLLYSVLGLRGALHDVDKGGNGIKNIKVRGRGVQGTKGLGRLYRFWKPDGTELLNSLAQLSESGTHKIILNCTRSLLLVVMISIWSVRAE
jgi:kumamolisin